METGDIPIEVQAFLSDTETIEYSTSWNNALYAIATVFDKHIIVYFLLSILVCALVVLSETTLFLYGISTLLLVLLLDFAHSYRSTMKLIITNKRIFVYKESVFGGITVNYAPVDKFVTATVYRGLINRITNTVSVTMYTKRDTGTLHKLKFIDQSEIPKILSVIEQDSVVEYNPDSPLGPAQLVMKDTEKVISTHTANLSYKFYDKILSPRKFTISSFSVVVTYILLTTYDPDGIIYAVSAISIAVLVLYVYILPALKQFLNEGVYVTTNERIIGYQKVAGTEYIYSIHKDHVQWAKITWSNFQRQNNSTSIRINAIRGSHSITLGGVPYSDVNELMTEILGDSKVVQEKGVLR